MKFIKPKNINSLYEALDNIEKQYLLAGGTDINVQIKNGTIIDPNIIYIDHIKELSGIEEENDLIFQQALKETLEKTINKWQISQYSFLLSLFLC